MALAKMDAGNTPSEFGGVPGIYGNVDTEMVVTETAKTDSPYEQVDPLQAHQERMALMQTDPTDTTSMPAYGIGGVKVA